MERWIIFGDIQFGTDDDVDAPLANIVDIGDIIVATGDDDKQIEAVAEQVIEEGHFNSYVILGVYKGTVVFQS